MKTKNIKFSDAAQEMSVGDIFEPSTPGWSDLELCADKDGIKFFKTSAIDRIHLSPSHFMLTGKLSLMRLKKYHL